MVIPVIAHKPIDYTTNTSNNDDHEAIVSPLMALNSQDGSKPESFSKSSVSSYNGSINIRMPKNTSIPDPPPVKYNKMKDSASSSQSNQFK